jgi:hypothetical protein
VALVLKQQLLPCCADMRTPTAPFLEAQAPGQGRSTLPRKPVLASCCKVCGRLTVVQWAK